MIALTTELQRMGGNIKTTPNELQILPSTLNPTQPVRTYADHRIAMAFAPLQLRFPNLQIENPEVVDKSFPEFWDEFAKILNA